MDRKTIGEALKRLRETKFPQKEDLRKATGIHIGTITETEAGLNLPNVFFIQKWVNACGITLAQFFADLEPQSSQADSKDLIQVTIKRKHKKKHEELEEILNGGGDAADFIAGNITVFHRDHVRERRKR